jgi:hypothetical protein
MDEIPRSRRIYSFNGRCDTNIATKRRGFRYKIALELITGMYLSSDPGRCQ